MGPISQSQMNLNESCPHAWYYYRIHAPSIVRDTSYADLGTVLHKSIAEYYGIIHDNPHEGEIEGTYKQVLDRHWTQHESNLKALVSRKDKCVANFLNFEKTRMKSGGNYKPTLVEGNITGIINRIEYRSIVDAYWIDSGTAVDWKTGNKVILEAPDYIQGQVTIMILRSFGYPVNRFLFVSLLAGTVLELPKVEDAFVEVRAMKMIDHWNKGEFPKNKNPQSCQWCNWILRCDMEDKGYCVWQL